MHFLHLFEVGEEQPGFCCVVWASFQLTNQLTLSRNVALSEGDVPLSLSKVLLEHRSIHTTSWQTCCLCDLSFCGRHHRGLID